MSEGKDLSADCGCGQESGRQECFFSYCVAAEQGWGEGVALTLLGSREEQEGKGGRSATLGNRTMDALLGEPRTVLIALDQSPGAEFAFNWAVKNYCKSNDNIHLLYVRRHADDITQRRMPTEVSARVEQEAAAGASALLQKYIDCATRANFHCKGRIVVGDEREEICKEVLWVCANVLIVGSRGLNRVQRVLLGSVSEYCAHHSACPVIIVKPSSSMARVNSDDSIDSRSEMHIPGLDSLEDA